MSNSTRSNVPSIQKTSSSLMDMILSVMASQQDMIQKLMQHIERRNDAIMSFSMNTLQELNDELKAKHAINKAMTSAIEMTKLNEAKNNPNHYSHTAERNKNGQFVKKSSPRNITINDQVMKKRNRSRLKDIVAA